jgi:hypothetical protein
MRSGTRGQVSGIFPSVNPIELSNWPSMGDEERESEKE